MARTHALYRFYGTDEKLLYTGITVDPSQRWRAHRDDKPWWEEITNITIEPHPDRDAALRAERAAIIAEKPLYNVVHNRPRRSASRRLEVVPTHDSRPRTEDLWTYRGRGGQTITTDRLTLGWEVSGTPLSDDYLPDEISARELMRMWLQRYGAEVVNIYWFVRPAYENAPFLGYEGGDFLSYYTWPINERTGERLNWNHLPIPDFDWTHSGHKGGFFQEVTGWKPSPLQQRAPLRAVLRAIGESQ